MAIFSGIVKLTKSQYETLKTNGTITVGDTTLTYDENTLYVTPEEGSVGSSYESGIGIDITSGTIKLKTPGFISITANSISLNDDGAYMVDGSFNSRYDNSDGTFEWLRAGSVFNIPIKAGDGVNSEIKFGNVSQYVELSSIGVMKTVIYDNTTLGDHISEILSYLNSENGGVLVNIGFKVGGTPLTADLTSIDTTQEGISVSTNSGQTLWAAGSYIIARPITLYDGENKTAVFDCGSAYTQGHSELEITNTTQESVAISGETFTISSSGVTRELYQNVNVKDVLLEHLIIIYHN